MTVMDIEHVDMGLPASFVWDYDERRPRLGRLYEKSKLSQWNAATDVDWTIEVDPGALPDVAQFAQVDWGDGGPISAAIGGRDDPTLLHEIVAQNHGWLISQFMHGEQGALVATAKICAAAETIDDKYYAAAQVADEARHVEAYQRYLDKIGVTYPVSTPLHDLLEQVMGHRHVDMTFLGMQILVEGVALAAFSLGGAVLANPLIASITELVRRDEARHVAFGVLSLSGRYDDMDPVDLREREDFVLEACALMRDRFQPTQVWEHFGIDVVEATTNFEQGPDMQAFRALLFSKVVPNLRKLGLLTPKVREGFEQLGILKYERYIDSATEAGELDPDDAAANAGDDPIVVFRAQLAGVDRIAPEPVLMVLAGVVDKHALNDIEPARIRLNVDNVDDGQWVLSIGGGDFSYEKAGDATVADVTVDMDVSTWTDIVAGRVSAPAAAIDGRISIAGDIMKALALDSLL
ncbi:MAG TPA: SCP2 sterol-binding domain-containing protein [Acidimicrobiales bacterium]|nr:SCP2 sterol-binding domain-containing protein [Acidimicrobiales bacterium]